MDVKKVREDFPILSRKIDGKPLIYFDSACTSLKPRQVIDAVSDYYTNYGACVGRSIHQLSVLTSERFDESREKVAKFIHARNSKEIIWTKNATEAINIVAHNLQFIKRGKAKVITTNLEHSSGLLPWQELARQGKIELDFVMCNAMGEFDVENFEEKIDRGTRLVSVVLSSNITGTHAPIKEIVKIAHDNGALVLGDGTQSVPHSVTDVKKMDIDFLAFSGHKMCGPTGVGALYGKEQLLKDFSPHMIGGETIDDADLTTYKLKDLPEKLEAGTPDIAGVFGMGATVDYLQKVGMEDIEKHERELSKALVSGLLEIPNLSLIGPKDPDKRNPLAAFSVKGMEPHDIASFMDKNGIAIRSGMSCAYPFHKAIGLPKGSARASLYLYNTAEEIGIFINKLDEIIKILT